MITNLRLTGLAILAFFVFSSVALAQQVPVITPVPTTQQSPTKTPTPGPNPVPAPGPDAVSGGNTTGVKCDPTNPSSPCDPTDTSSKTTNLGSGSPTSGDSGLGSGSPYSPGTSSTNNGGEILINPLGDGSTNLQTFLQSILDFAITIGSIVIVIMMVYIGFMFVTAQGNETKLSTARKALEWTVLGALLLLGSKVIAVGIQATVQALSVGQ